MSLVGAEYFVRARRGIIAVPHFFHMQCFGQCRFLREGKKRSSKGVLKEEQ
jgi:hypothetical protein